MSVPLSEKGELQAKQATEAVDKLGITEIYSSDQKRASDTAKTATKNLNLPIQFDERLRELGRGERRPLSGKSFADIPKDFLDKPEKYGGEPFAEMYERTREATTEVFGQADDDANILLVGHGGQQCMIIYCLLEDPNKPFDEKLFKEKYFRDRSNASITMMDMDEYKPEFKHLTTPTMIYGEDRGPITTVANTKK